jgi:hypothetical protein
MRKQLIPTKRLNKGPEIVAAFRASGKTRAEFSRQAGITVSMLDYYHHRVRAAERARLIPVEVTTATNSAADSSPRALAVWLRNGRRLEVSWHGDEQSLHRLVSLLERE